MRVGSYWPTDDIRGSLSLALRLPSGESTEPWKWSFRADFPIQRVIFHGYVSLPEGKSHKIP